VRDMGWGEALKNFVTSDNLLSKLENVSNHPAVVHTKNIKG